MQVTDIRFIATLERPSDYKGEFGFDWMRWHYEDSCTDYDKLKKEYTPTKIEGEEYFVPWLSMFPKQEGVRLRLFCSEPEGHENLGEITDEDIVKFKVSNGMRIEPEQMTLREADENDFVNVFCDNPLTDDVVVDILNRYDEVVGKLNVFKNANHEQFHFNITPVRVLRAGKTDQDIKLIDDGVDLDVTVNEEKWSEKRFKGFSDKNSNIEGNLANLQTYLNKQSLNQALLQCTLKNVYHIIIDEEKWIADDLIVDEGRAFKGNLLSIFAEEFQKQHPEASKKRGMLAFLLPIENVSDDNTKGAGGYAHMSDVDAKNFAIFSTNLWDKTSFAHEIAHVAGLEHYFKDEDDWTEKDIDNANERKRKIDTAFDEIIASKEYTTQEIGDLWSNYKDEMREINSVLYTYNRNPYKFKQGATENFMDYYNERKTFNKFQWKAMAEDIIKFYNS